MKIAVRFPDRSERPNFSQAGVQPPKPILSHSCKFTRRVLVSFSTFVQSALENRTILFHPHLGCQHQPGSRPQGVLRIDVERGGREAAAVP
jgi:hypothetical protein